MNLPTYLFVLVACCFYKSAMSNRASPPEKFLKLALAASKDAYLPPLANLAILGQIQGNWDTMPKLPSVVMGTLADVLPQPNVFSILPKQIYNPLFAWPVCSTSWWWAEWHIGKKSKVLMLKNGAQKLVVFGFRGAEAYSLRAMAEGFIANVTEDPTSVHNGYLDLYDDVASWFESKYQKVPADHTVILSGYDTGGPQAYIAALKVATAFDRRPDAVITFGSPTVGDLRFREQYASKVGCERTVSITSIQDIFSRFPVGTIRPCEDTPVDSGRRPPNPVADLLKGIFLKAFPDMVPQLINTLLPKDIKEQVDKLFPPEKLGEMIKGSMTTVDELYNALLDFEYSHNLYQGYETGMKKLYKEKDIDFGCYKKL